MCELLRGALCGAEQHGADSLRARLRSQNTRHLPLELSRTHLAHTKHRGAMRCVECIPRICFWCFWRIYIRRRRDPKHKRTHFLRTQARTRASSATRCCAPRSRRAEPPPSPPPPRGARAPRGPEPQGACKKKRNRHHDADFSRSGGMDGTGCLSAFWPILILDSWTAWRSGKRSLSTSLLIREPGSTGRAAALRFPDEPGQ